VSVAIQIERLSKQYRLGQISGARLADDINRWVAKIRGKEDPLSKVGSAAHARHASGSSPSTRNGSQDVAIWALKDVSFEVNQGEVLGIVGRNGSGKSTALKILSRVTAPTQGEARVKGRIASLLEVGTGFHPELTGRENIFLNGAILGMTKFEIRGKFDEIVAFSGVEQFIDTPVKRYSSGMYVRLAFAVAAHLEPEILIVDEVLAVGDAEFQKKCLGKLKDVAGDGRTILFVSHNAEAVRKLCQRGIWLKNGRLHKDGPVGEVIEAYLDSDSSELSFSSANPAYGLVIHKVQLKNNRGLEAKQFQPGEDLIVELHYHARQRLEKPIIAIGVFRGEQQCFSAHMLLDGARPEFLDGPGTIACRFNSIPLLPQGYIVKVAVRARNQVDVIIPYQEAASFSIVANLGLYGYKGEGVDAVPNFSPVGVPYEWRLPDGTTKSMHLGQSTN
jgi:lipopolysaccharide transport system ATP-binding protein